MKIKVTKQKKKIEDIQWQLKEVWREYIYFVDSREKQKAEEALKKYRDLQMLYKREKAFDSAL